MRILMTADAVGGVWTYALELARALAPFGIDTTLATMGPAPTIDQVADAADVPGLDLVTSTFALEWMDDPWRDVEAAGAWLLGLEARVQPSIVHLNGFAHGALPWRAPVVVVGHSCVASWAEATGGSIDRAWMERYRRMVTGGLCAADWVVAPSASMLRALQRHYGPLPNASVILNGRDPARFAPGNKEPFVFAAGRVWDRAKNIEAVAAIARRVSWPVVIAGEGGQLGKLSSHDVASWLARASIFAAPARYEPFGLLPLEAALSGCALVLSDVDSLREVWDDAAIYVDSDDHDALRDAIERLIGDPRLRASRAAAARSRALSYTPARMGDAYVRLYSAQLIADTCELKTEAKAS